MLWIVDIGMMLNEVNFGWFERADAGTDLIGLGYVIRSRLQLFRSLNVFARKLRFRFQILHLAGLLAFVNRLDRVFVKNCFGRAATWLRWCRHVFGLLGIFFGNVLELNR